MEAKQNTMLGVIAKVWVTLCLGYITVFAAQLPPEMLVDKYLLQAKMLSEEKNHKDALEAMDRIVALQKEHDLTLPEEFPFHYAQTALAGGAVQAAIDSANRYLSVAGREGKYYRQALELLVKAERRLPEPAVDPVGTTPAKTDLDPQPQAVPTSPLQTRKTAETRPVVDCSIWNTKEFFQAATVEDVTTCLDDGADPNIRGKYSMRPVHWAAAYNNNPDVIKALVAAGADLSKHGKGVGNSATWWERRKSSVWGWDAWYRKMTPLDYAAAYNENPAVAQALIDAGDNPKKRWSKGVLGFAALNENSAVAQVLIDAGADVNKYTVGPGYYLYALHIASAFNNNPAVAQLLIDAGADVNKKLIYGERPLHLAAMYNENPAVTQVLINAGADVWAKSSGNTPLDDATKTKENPAVAQVLRDAMAKSKAHNAAKTKRVAGGGRGFAALVAGATGAAIASAGGLDAATATEIGATIGGSVLAGEAVGTTGASATSGENSGNTGATSGGGPCQVPGYPNPPGGVSNLGVSWCPASVSLQVRSFALQAAGAECAIATGSSSTPEQIEARRREIRAACDRLAALGHGDCQCPPGLGQ